MSTAAATFRSIKEMFDSLAQLPAPARLDALEQAGLDESSRNRLRDLLAADAALARTTARPALDVSRLHPAPCEGLRVGPFQIERELGRGGMGSVYLAQRAVPGGVQRVALKCLYPLGAAAEFERRFHAEIGALSQLSHPHIGRLIDAGQEADGRCWIAMEFIQGVPLLEYCDAHNLAIRARLALFDSLCDAVSAAHRSLIVHRDIKSSNVLVREDGELFLIDFGIARALTAAADVTQLEQRFLSPLNAAPEQIRGEPTTTACDVYGLGALLYELLCGVAPIVQSSASGDELREAVLQQVPLLASARLRALSRSDPELAQRIVRQRACTDIARLAHVAGGDLAQVCAVALRKRPQERCASVDSLRDDLARAISGRPILARGNDRLYRARRWLRRHVLAMTLATVATVSLLGAVFALWSQTRSLERERDHAREQSRLAQQQGQRAEFLGTFLLDAFYQADPAHTMGATLTAKQILDAGVRQLESAQDTDPESRIRIAITLADVEYRLGLFAEGNHLIDYSRAHLADLKAPPARLIAHQHYIEALRARYDDRWPDLMREADAGLAALDGRPGDVSGQRLWMDLKRLRADASFAEDDYVGMLPLYRELVASIGTLHWLTRAEAWDLRIRLAWALEQTEETLAEARAMLTQVLQEQAVAHAEHTPSNAFALALLATAELRSEHPHLARQYAEKSLAIYRKTYGERHPFVARALDWAGDAETQDGSPKLAIQHHLEAMRMWEALGKKNKDNYIAAEHNISIAYDDGLHDTRSAEKYLRKAIAGFEKMLGRENSATVGSMSNLAFVLIEQGRYSEADSLLQDALRWTNERMPKLHTPEFLVALQAALALVRHAQGQDQQARELLQASLPSLHWWPMQNRVVVQRARALGKILNVPADRGEPQDMDMTLVADWTKAVPSIQVQSASRP
jgi:serine/threonine protein kinase/tetratricopeptide (TPR) repeat protein